MRKRIDGEWSSGLRHLELEGSCSTPLGVLPGLGMQLRNEALSDLWDKIAETQ